MASVSTHGPAALAVYLVATLAGCAPGFVRLPPSLAPAAAIVVLGNRPPTDAAGHVMPETDRRVRAGVALYERGLAPRLVLTGGPAPHDRVEAEVMRDLAIHLGVPAAAILIEPTARDTIDNARESVRLLCADDSPAPCQPDIILVSSPYHLVRAQSLFECAGATVQPAPTPVPDSPAYRMRATWHEHLVRLVYAFSPDPCAAARP
jgi:uncharacterized SAM-binding protein YcdF (DUF218 family)